MTACAADAFDHVVGALAVLLDRAEFATLTQHDLDVYATPEGVLSSERAQEGVYVGEVVASKN
eukprot:33349-Chlamydomonas_euryale.AAC.1